MSVIKILEPSEVWSFFQGNPDDVRGLQYEIARYEEYGVNIYISSGYEDILTVSVEADDVQIYEEDIYWEYCCASSIQNIYDEFLSSNVFNYIEEKDAMDAELELEEREELIVLREEELDNAIYEFCEYVATSKITMDLELDVLEDLKEHFLEYMARKHGIEIYRPMYLEGEDGEEFYTEYPYPQMIFEDEENPIYK